MDPTSAAFQRVFRNPFAYAAFKSTEPWLLRALTYLLTYLPSAARSRVYARAFVPGWTRRAASSPLDAVFVKVA